MKRIDIAKCALTWLGTPYHHQAGVKGVGADCAYFVGKVAEELGAIKEFKVAPYSIEWHWHQKEEMMLKIMEQMGAIPVETYDVGDILAFQYGRTCSHVGIYLGDNQFIHAHLPAGKVLVNSLSGEYADRLRKFYKFPNLED